MHDAGSVHFDICPSNIGMCSDGRMRLLDFEYAMPAKDVFAKPDLELLWGRDGVCVSLWRSDAAQSRFAMLLTHACVCVFMCPLAADYYAVAATPEQMDARAAGITAFTALVSAHTPGFLSAMGMKCRQSFIDMFTLELWVMNLPNRRMPGKTLAEKLRYVCAVQWGCLATVVCVRMAHVLFLTHVTHMRMQQRVG